MNSKPLDDFKELEMNVELQKMENETLVFLAI